MSSKKAKTLIEVAMPVKEVSLESVRDKSIRHGHISTLHLWWARRPLPVCRATVFASLVPDPEDELCPEAFKEAIDALIGAKAPEPYRSVYKPYADIPHTAVVDPMPDNRRNRLLMFIGKFSDKYVRNEKLGKTTSPKETLSDYSLIKWESRTNESVLTIARKLIWVAHDPENNSLQDYDRHWNAIEEAKSQYESLIDPESHPDAVQLRSAYDEAIAAFQERMPRVFDPFAGGGAIPLEAARLGCRSYGNDINPVAHIVQRASLEFPQKFGQAITYSQKAYIDKYGEAAWKKLPSEWKDHSSSGEPLVRIANRLAHDVEHEATALLHRAETKIGHLYPEDESGNKPIAYYWARTAECSNPSCKADVPLLKQLYLAKTKSKSIHLRPNIVGNKISFSIQEGHTNEEGFLKKGVNLQCPCCGSVTPAKTIKDAFFKNITSERIIAVIIDTPKGKDYRLPTKAESEVIRKCDDLHERFPESMDNGNYRDLKIPKWGYSNWSEMFSNRQLLAMQTLVESIPERLKNAEEGSYDQAVLTYLGVFIDRVSATLNMFGRIDITRETFQTPFARQAIPMIFDYPEINIFSGASGSSINQLNWILRYLNGEQFLFPSRVMNASSGDKKQFDQKSLHAVVTDPPYYDAIAYADLSDFFYIWLKRSVGSAYPLTFLTPQTPKVEECTALKHHHGSNEQANQHFEDKLAEIFSAIEKQTSGTVSIMFAHQSTKAWTTLCNSVLSANLSMNGSWAIDTEMSSRSLAIAGDTLTSSVTVACRPIQRSGVAEYRDVAAEIKSRVNEKVSELYAQGFRGADLLTACFGHAVGVFGRYESVEKADGTEVTTEELLQDTREFAYAAIVSDFPSDASTQFYIGWLNLFGSKPVKYDELRRIAQIGLNVNLKDLEQENILIADNDNQKLASSEERFEMQEGIGNRVSASDIDKCHRMLHFWRIGNRLEVLNLIQRFAPNAEHNLWRVMNALFEVLPKEHPDREATAGILSALESLLREAKQSQIDNGEQTSLEL